MLPNFSWLDNVVTKLVTPICEPKENDYCICISKRINLKYAYEQFKKIVSTSIPLCSFFFFGLPTPSANRSDSHRFMANFFHPHPPLPEVWPTPELLGNLTFSFSFPHSLTYQSN